MRQLTPSRGCLRSARRTTGGRVGVHRRGRSATASAHRPKHRRPLDPGRRFCLCARGPGSIFFEVHAVTHPAAPRQSLHPTWEMHPLDPAENIFEGARPPGPTARLFLLVAPGVPPWLDQGGHWSRWAPPAGRRGARRWTRGSVGWSRGRLTAGGGAGGGAGRAWCMQGKTR